jgi:hypothetical protein
VGYSPKLVGHSGSSGSFLYYDPLLDLHLAGTINQVARHNAPFRLMIAAAQAVRQAAGDGRRQPPGLLLFLDLQSPHSRPYKPRYTSKYSNVVIT